MKRIICLLTALLIAFSISGCSETGEPQDTLANPSASTTAPTTELMFDLAAFKADINTCRSEINSASIYVANMGTYEYNFWKALGKLSDDMAEKAFEWLEKNSDATEESIKAVYESIRQKYKEISITEYSGNEAEKIYTAFDRMYHAYTDMYLLVTSPSGSITDFATKLNNCIETIQESDSELSLFLD